MRIVMLILVSMTITCCNRSSKSIDTWIGNYDYSETPIEATAGYAMVMTWKLSITRQENLYQGMLTIDGQQTSMKLETNVIGDDTKIAVIYSGLMEGSAGQLTPGDTLFTITKGANELRTHWVALEPRLSEHPPKECPCFYKVAPWVH